MSCFQPSLNDLAVEGTLKTNKRAFKNAEELMRRSSSVMDCHTMARGSIPGWSGLFTELHVLRKGVLSLNDLAVEGT